MSSNPELPSNREFTPSNTELTSLNQVLPETTSVSLEEGTEDPEKAITAMFSTVEGFEKVSPAF